MKYVKNEKKPTIHTITLTQWTTKQKDDMKNKTQIKIQPIILPHIFLILYKQNLNYDEKHVYVDNIY